MHKRNSLVYKEKSVGLHERVCNFYNAFGTQNHEIIAVLLFILIGKFVMKLNFKLNLLDNFNTFVTAVP